MTRVARLIDQSSQGERLAVVLAVVQMGLALSQIPGTIWLGIAAGIAGAAMQPWAGVVAILLSLPFHQHPLRLAGLELSITEVAIASALVGSICHQLWLRPRVPGQTSLSPNPWVDWCIAGWLVATLVSLLVTEFPKQSLREVRWLIVEPLVVLFLVRWAIPASRTTVVLGALIVGGSVASAIALVTMGIHGDLFRLSTRATEPYSSPNHLALFLGRTGAVAFALLLFTRPGPTAPRWLRPGLLACLGLMGLALLRSLSLGAWLGTVAATLVVVGFRSRRWMMITLALSVGATIVALAVLPPERTFGRFDGATGTGLFRIQIWTSSVRMIADHPVLGIGLDNFLYRYQEEYILPEAWEEPNLSHPHNVLLHLWLQLGLLGLATGCALGIWVARQATRLLRSHASTHQTVGAAALGTFVDLVVHGSFDNSYFLPDAAIIFWVMIGLLMIAGKNVEPGDGSN